MKYLLLLSLLFCSCVLHKEIRTEQVCSHCPKAVWYETGNPNYTAICVTDGLWGNRIIVKYKNVCIKITPVYESVFVIRKINPQGFEVIANHKDTMYYSFDDKKWYN